jgi:hypothetical protein
VIGRPVFRDHLPLRQEVPELRHDNFGCAKKLAEGSFLRQGQPDSSAALILDVLANERKSSAEGSVPRLCLLLFISVMVEAEVRAAEDDDDDDVTRRVAPGVSSNGWMRFVSLYLRRLLSET